MRTTLLLALRNLLRNRRRSLATVLALAIGAAAVLLFGGYSADIRYTLLTDYVQTGGHLRIQHRDFRLFGNGNPTAYGIAHSDRIAQALRADAELAGRVRVISPMLQFGGLAGNYAAGVSRPVLGLGFVAADVARMRQWNEFDVLPIYGPYALLNTPPDAAVVGEGLARVLLLCEPLHVADCPRPSLDAEAAVDSPNTLPADVAALAQSATAEPPGKQSPPSAGANASQDVRIELLATQPRGTPNVAAVKVVAAENQGYKELDEITVKVHLEQAQRLIYGRGEPKVTALMLQLEHTGDIGPVAQRVRQILDRDWPGHALEVLDFEQINPFYGETLALFSTIFGFIFVLIGGIVLFTVGNTMMAAVMERTNEIGTVRAIGVRQQGVRRLFIIEGVLLGCVGSALGIATALLVAMVVNSLHLSWLPPGSSSPLPLTVRVAGESAMIVFTFLGLVIITTLSAWLPAWRAARLSIVEALRHT